MNYNNIKNNLNSDCEIVKLPQFYVYPIYKNGRSSTVEYAQNKNYTILKNKEISKITDTITVFIREPKERFISGIDTYFNLYHRGNIKKSILLDIENLNIIDKHFMPQVIWLMHLFRYFKGEVTLRPVKELLDIVPLRIPTFPVGHSTWQKLTPERKEKILSINYNKLIKDDIELCKKYLGKTVSLKIIVKEFYKCFVQD